MGSLDTRPLSLFEAMCTYSDPAIVSEMMALKDIGADVPFVHMSGKGRDREEARYLDLMTQLQESFVDKLRNGNLVACGYDSGAGFDQPIIQISPDRWRILKPDFDNSSATLGGREIIGIMVVPREETARSPSATAAAAAMASPPIAARLVISKAKKEVTLEGTRVSVKPRSFSLIVLLAEALLAESGPLPTVEIKQKLFAPNTSDLAVADVIRDIRDGLSCIPGQAAKRYSLVQSRARVGYFLDMQRNEVMIQP